MLVTGDLFRKSTPVFRVVTAKEHNVSRGWGGVYLDGSWQFPAYYPFGKWTFEDIRKLAPFGDWQQTALDQLKAVRDADVEWTAAQAAYEAKSEVPLDVPEGFFPSDFTPYAHQRLGIVRASTWWRTFLLWEPGTGKTRTAVDALRLRRIRGQFKRALVIAPPVVLAAWRNEVARCTRGEWKTVVWDGSREAEILASDADIVLVSYTRMRLEAERALKATKELEVTADQRKRYNLPVLTEDEVHRLKHEASHPLHALEYDTIIADESHYLGNFESSQTAATLELSAKASWRLCLTGTPGDDPRKLYAQLQFLSPALLAMPYHKFCERHLVYSPRNKHVVVGFRHLNEVNARMNQVSMRMKKADCLDLPPLTVVDLRFDLGPQQIARTNELVLEMRTSDVPLLQYLHPDELDEADMPEVKARRLPHGAARVSKLLQVISGYVSMGSDYSVCDACPSLQSCVDARIRPYTKKCTFFPTAPPKRIVRDVECTKLDVVSQTLQDVLEADPSNKVIIWACFTPELEDIESYLKAQKIGYVRMSDSSKSGPVIDKFQTDPACRVYLSQVSTGIGITLTAANYMLFYSLPWDPLQYQQAIDRYNRPGQSRAMTVYRFLTSQQTPALDQRVASVLAFKKKISLTLVEQIACASCDQQVPCNERGTLPFREKCKYAANIARPTAVAEVIE